MKVNWKRLQSSSSLFEDLFDKFGMTNVAPTAKEQKMNTSHSLRSLRDGRDSGPHSEGSHEHCAARHCTYPARSSTCYVDCGHCEFCADSGHSIHAREQGRTEIIFALALLAFGLNPGKQ